MRFVLGLALLVGTVCVGQQPKPLTCPKYEHVMFQRETCIPDGCFMASSEPYCAPDLHVVTEKEWAELQERLKWLDEEIRCLSTKNCAIGLGKQQ